MTALKRAPPPPSAIPSSANGVGTAPPGTAGANRKSLWWAYMYWMFGGMFGLHLFYLGRDGQAFLMFSTFGGYVIGWVMDAFKLPRYVRDANEDDVFIREFVQKLQKHRKPPFSTSRFISSMITAYVWGQLVIRAIPDEEFLDIDWSFMHWLTPLGIALGVWVVGNIGRERGTPWIAIVVAYTTYLIRYYIYDEDIWFKVVVLATAWAFDSWSKDWRRQPPKQRWLPLRIMTLLFCGMLYMSLWGSYIYFNGTVTDSNGDEVPVHEALQHFFTSAFWTDFKRSLVDLYIYGQHHGWYEIWKEIIDLSDVQGEQNAYKVLDVAPTASQSEITTRWRALSREFHPDKVKDPDQQRAAQEKFMEIQQAYEILSNIKSKRKRKNKKSVEL